MSIVHRSSVIRRDGVIRATKSSTEELNEFISEIIQSRYVVKEVNSLIGMSTIEISSNLVCRFYNFTDGSIYNCFDKLLIRKTESS